MNYSCRKLFVFGEILYDIFDGVEKLGGAPFNVAYNLRMQGHSPVMISRVGPDRMGVSILSFMEKAGLSTDFIETDGSRGTGCVDVSLVNGEPSYRIRKNQAYDYISPPEADTDGAFIYYGTLAARSAVSKRSLLHLLDNKRSEKFYDVNLRSGNWDMDTVRLLAGRADYLKMNGAELDTISGGLSLQNDDYRSACTALLEMFGLKGIFVTFGERGAAFVGRDRHLRSSKYPVKNMRDTVGAGDAFCSVVIDSILKNEDMEKALNRAAYFASAVCSIQGAITEKIKFYEKIKEEMNAV